ncbi:MAG: WG repeat-containing protein [Oscillospiraceae bacterium]|nr:WG repeat-containing protein [Oscillospiraceae bacterium]
MNIKKIREIISKIIKKLKNLKNFKAKVNIKTLAIHIASLCVLLFFTGYMISYAKGDFEIPFFPRDKIDAQGIQIETNTPTIYNPADTTEETTTAEITNLIHVVNPSDLLKNANTSGSSDTSASQVNPINPAQQPATETQPAFELYSDDMKNQGFTVTDGVYEPYDEEQINSQIDQYKSQVQQVTASGGDPQSVSKPDLYQYKFVQITPEYPMIANTETTTLPDGTHKNVIEPIMDYFLINRNNTEVLCDASGKTIDENFAASGYTILQMRDSQNRTVFKNNTDGLYYIYDPLLKQFIQTDFDEASGDRGILFMYPSYYGAAGDVTAYAGGSYWGYTDTAAGTVIVKPQFSRTFNFSEGIGIAYSYEWRKGNRLYFYDESWQNLIAGYYAYDSGYFAPNTPDSDAEAKPLDINSLGFFYFDHGLTRVYAREFYQQSRRIDLTSERDILVDKNGKEFYIPEDYMLKAYSNGMILLEKDGCYGFMNYLGEWVAQPIFTYAEPFFEGVAVIGFKDGKKALIDTKGNLITKFQYDSISNCTGGIVALYEKGVGWTVLNKVRKQIAVG